MTRRIAAGPQQRQRHAQQRFDRRRRRLGRQLAQYFARCAELPQRGECERLHSRTLLRRQLRQHVAQRAARAHRLQGVGAALEQQRKRRRGGLIHAPRLDHKARAQCGPSDAREAP
jgi:hypothetical protein